MRKAMVLGVIGLAGTLASPAFADELFGFPARNEYGYGQTRVRLLRRPDRPNHTGRSDKSDRFGYGIFGGWAFNKWVGVEVGLVGGSKFSTDIFPESSTDDFYEVSRVNLKGAEASIVGTFWIGKNFAIFGRAGMFGWDAEVSESYGLSDDPDSKTTLEVNDNGFDPMFGIGIQTVLDDALIRLEYKMTEIGDFRYFNDQGTTSTADDIEYNWINNEVSSLNLSIVWTWK